MTDVTVTYHARALEQAHAQLQARLADQSAYCSSYAATGALQLHLDVEPTGDHALIAALELARTYTHEIDGLQLRGTQLDTDALIVPRHAPGEPYQLAVVHESLSALMQTWERMYRLERFPLPCSPASLDLPTFGLAAQPRD